MCLMHKLKLCRKHTIKVSVATIKSDLQKQVFVKTAIIQSLLLKSVSQLVGWFSKSLKNIYEGVQF